MKHTLERQEHLTLRQAEVVALRTEDGARHRRGAAHRGGIPGPGGGAVPPAPISGAVPSWGTCVEESGPDGMHAAGPLTESLLALGLPLRRFKTGTPPRVNAPEHRLFPDGAPGRGCRPRCPSASRPPAPPENRAVCWLTYTTPETHRIIRENLDRSPLYSGVIEGVGPRYCPSIETKIVRFPDKERHQLFIEPMGLDTEEMYIQGFSSSLPEDVQLSDAALPSPAWSRRR